MTASGDEYVQKLLVEQAAGLTPDVIFCGDNYAGFAGRGMLLDLKPYVQRDPSVQLADYYPQLVRAFSSGSKLYALPRDIAPSGWSITIRRFSTRPGFPTRTAPGAGTTSPHPERGNKDFLTVAKKLTRPGTSTSNTVFGYSAGDNSWTMDNFVYSSGASFVDNLNSPTKLLYDDPRIVKAIQLTEDLAGKYNVSPSVIDLASSGVGSHELFAQGHIAMYVSGIWEVPRFRQEIQNFDWDIAAFPAGPTGLHGVQTGYSGYGIAASCRHKQAAWELVKYLAGPIGLSNLARSGLAQPAIARLANSSLWLDGKRPKNRKLTIEEVPYVHFAVISPKWSEVSALVAPKLQLVWNGTLTAKQAVGQFLPPAQAKLDELNHPPYHPPLNWAAGLAAMLDLTLLLAGWVWQGARKDIRAGADARVSRRGASGLLVYRPVADWDGDFPAGADSGFFAAGVFVLGYDLACPVGGGRQLCRDGPRRPVLEEPVGDTAVYVFFRPAGRCRLACAGPAAQYKIRGAVRFSDAVLSARGCLYGRRLADLAAAV